MTEIDMELYKTFSTRPKTRKHVRPKCISRDRAMAFMEYLFEEGFRDRMSYKFILFFGTNDKRTVERYIGRPGGVKCYGGSTRIFRMNRLSGKIAQFDYFNERRVPAKKGLMEYLGFISIMEDGIVVLHHEGLPYFTRQVSLEEVGSFEHKPSFRKLK